MTCAIYIRKSREDATKAAHRLTAQREQLPLYAKAQGWQVEIYDDGHASAARGKIEDLVERSRLEAAIRADQVDIILCIELSRLSRDESLQDYVAWLHLCSEHRVRLATPSRILDPAHPPDWMLLLMEGGFSSVEMKVLQKRMAEGRIQAIREGRYISGNPPIPYIYDRAIKGLRVDETQNQKLQALFKMTEKHSTREISEQLNLPVITVRRAIAEDRLLFYQGLRRDPVTSEIIPGSWPAVIDAEQADKVRLSRRDRVKTGPRRQAAGLLSNLDIMTCGYCGRSVRGIVNSRPRKDGTRVNYYTCKARDTGLTCSDSRMVPQHIVDDRVLGNVFSTLGNTDQLMIFWHSADQPDVDGKIKKLITQEVKLKDQKKRLVAAIAEGIIDFADAKERRQDIEAGLASILEQKKALSAIERQEPDWDSLQITRDDFDLLDFTEQRDVIQVVIKSIRLFSAYLLVDYHFPKDAKGNSLARIHLPPPGKTDPRGHYRLKT